MLSSVLPQLLYDWYLSYFEAGLHIYKNCWQGRTVLLPCPKPNANKYRYFEITDLERQKVLGVTASFVLLYKALKNRRQNLGDKKLKDLTSNPASSANSLARSLKSSCG